MNVRQMKYSDLPTIEALHNKYYPQFNFPDFMHLLNAFVIEDDKDNIILGGGIEAIANTLLVTNQEMSRVKIGRALVEAQRIALFTASKYGIKEIVAFVDNDEYVKHLIKHGFSESHKMLYMRLPDGPKQT